MGRISTDFRLLIGNFSAYLVGRTKKVQQQKRFVSSTSHNGTSTPWIERLLLQTPMEDHRKTTVALILSRYLIKAKKLGYEQAYAIIWEWPDRCGELKARAIKKPL